MGSAGQGQKSSCTKWGLFRAYGTSRELLSLKSLCLFDHPGKSQACSLSSLPLPPDPLPHSLSFYLPCMGLHAEGHRHRALTGCAEKVWLFVLAGENGIWSGVWSSLK